MESAAGVPASPSELSGDGDSYVPGPRTRAQERTLRYEL